MADPRTSARVPLAFCALVVSLRNGTARIDSLPGAFVQVKAHGYPWRWKIPVGVDTGALDTDTLRTLAAKALSPKLAVAFAIVTDLCEQQRGRPLVLSEPISAGWLRGEGAERKADRRAFQRLRKEAQRLASFELATKGRGQFKPVLVESDGGLKAHGEILKVIRGKVKPKADGGNEYQYTHIPAATLKLKAQFAVVGIGIAGLIRSTLHPRSNAPRGISLRNLAHEIGLGTSNLPVWGAAKFWPHAAEQVSGIFKAGDLGRAIPGQQDCPPADRIWTFQKSEALAQSYARISKRSGIYLVESRAAGRKAQK